MITLTQKIPPYKLPGKTSFFVEFDYQPNIVDTMHIIPNAIYHKKLQTWEIPVTSLSRAIDSLINLDEITLNLCSDEGAKIEPQDTKLNKTSYVTQPYSYQEEGIKFGINHNKWLLLDAPGLGKTLQMILLAQELKQRGEINHCLIVCGINTLKYNWKKEIETHSNLSCRILGQKYNKKGKLTIGSISDRINDLKSAIDEFFVITNVETLRDNNIIKELTKGKNKFDMIVADELHKMKSPTSQQGKNFLKLQSKYQIGLTGTLLLNSPLDAYVPLKWINADNSTYTNFKYYYCTFTGPFNNILSGYKNIAVLKDQLEDVSLRRTKDILDLPPKNIIHEYVEMDAQQQLFYENIVNGVVEEVDKVELNTSTLLSMVTRLRQATVDPSILSSNETLTSAKLNRAIDLAKEILDTGEKVVIFSEYKAPLDILMNELKEYNPLLCTGDVKDTIISENVDKFQNEETNKVMCATISKMGTGITLTKASYAIFIDSSWTAAVNVQAEDRIYRIGSKSPVFIYYLWTKDTIDERVKEIVTDKEAISDFIVDSKISDNTLESLRKYIVDLNMFGR